MVNQRSAKAPRPRGRVRIAAYPPEFFDSLNLGVRRIRLAALVRKTSSLLRGSGFKSRGTHQSSFVWRNWQTRTVESRISCEFESHHEHHRLVAGCPLGPQRHRVQRAASDRFESVRAYQRFASVKGMGIPSVLKSRSFSVRSRALAPGIPA